MITLSAFQLLHAIEGGDLEAIRDDGVIVLLVDLQQVLIMPESPTPQISTTVGHAVRIMSGDVVAATIQADSAGDAEEIAGALADLLKIE